MKISKFNQLIAKIEGKKKQEDIAQISEQTAIVKTLLLATGVNIYTIINNTNENIIKEGLGHENRKN